MQRSTASWGTQTLLFWEIHFSSVLQPPEKMKWSVGRRIRLRAAHPYSPFHLWIVTGRSIAHANHILNPTPNFPLILYTYFVLLWLNHSDIPYELRAPEDFLKWRYNPLDTSATRVFHYRLKTRNPARSRQHAWHSCRADCIVISENPQGLAAHMVQPRTVSALCFAPLG